MLYYPLDEGRGNVAADASGNKLDGVVSADWTDSPSGKALSFDGQPAGIIKGPASGWTEVRQGFLDFQRLDQAQAVHH